MEPIRIEARYFVLPARPLTLLRRRPPPLPRPAATFRARARNCYFRVYNGLSGARVRVCARVYQVDCVCVKIAANNGEKFVCRVRDVPGGREAPRPLETHRRLARYAGILFFLFFPFFENSPNCERQERRPRKRRVGLSEANGGE